MAKFNQVPLAASRPERFRNRVDIWQPTQNLQYVKQIQALNPWLYWQFNDASYANGATTADSASTCLRTNNASWGGLTKCGNTDPSLGMPQPPPNNGTYGSHVTSTRSIMADGRIAVQNTGPGAISSVGWAYTADSPIAREFGFWIAVHFKFAVFTAPYTDSDWLWFLPGQAGSNILLDVATDGVHDRIECVGNHFGGGGPDLAQWFVPAGTIGTTPHQLIWQTIGVSFDGAAYHTSETAWLDGVDLGTVGPLDITAGDSPFRLENQGVQAGANLHPADSFTLQDLVIMGDCFYPSGSSYPAATPMTDALATTLYNDWSSLL